VVSGIVVSAVVVSETVVSGIVVSVTVASVAVLGVLHAVKLKISTTINIRFNNLSLCPIFCPF
jgi:hypothetical protein